ncbi:hypothetical protein F5Y16DRAFT_134116 [Xylariaceae sp. FL0255]|nr:hypothetical protein F5Y16DRAFT_134116 [Xylariaceae sp. FL0255]
MHVQADDNSLRPYDEVIDRIVDYAFDYEITSENAWTRSKMALIDSLGVAIESLAVSKECAALVQPLLPGSGSVVGGFKLPGTSLSLDPLSGAFALGAMIRYLDHNDAFAGAEWGHPSDNLGAVLVTADVLSRDALARGKRDEALSIKQVLLGLIKTYEIQGAFQEKNAFNKVGLDHTILAKIASTAVVASMMGLSKEQGRAAVSHAWIDGHPLRIFRQSPNAGPRKGWAAGDACMRAMHLATLAKAGQPGLRTPLTASRWGFYEVLNKGNAFDLPRAFGSWVVENSVFKVLTAEGHGLTAVEAAMQASKELQQRGLDPIKDVESIQVKTQQAAMIIINKAGPLHNAADRDHCMRFMIAVVLLKGGVAVETEDYQDDSSWATDSRVEHIRSLVTMEEDPQMTADYHNPAIRSGASSLTFKLKNGETFTSRIDFPLGHPARNEESYPAVRAKTIRNLEMKLPADKVKHIMETFDRDDFEKMPTSEFIDLFHL